MTSKVRGSKLYPKLNKWYFIRVGYLRTIDVLGIPFKFNSYIPTDEIPLFINHSFCLHKAIYPYSCRKVYSDLYSISHIESGTIIIDNFQYSDLIEVVTEYFQKHSVISIVKLLDKQPPLKKKLLI